MMICLKASSKAELIAALEAAGFATDGAPDPARVCIFEETQPTGGTVTVDGVDHAVRAPTGAWLANIAGPAAALGGHPLRVYPATPDRVIA